MESPSDVAKSFMLAQSDDFREVGNFQFGLITFCYVSGYLAWVIAAFIHYVVGTADTSTHPTKEWKISTIVIAILMSTVWAMWLVNIIFDNRGGEIHEYFERVFKISLVFPIVIFGLMFYLLSGYGT